MAIGKGKQKGGKKGKEKESTWASGCKGRFEDWNCQSQNTPPMYQDFTLTQQVTVLKRKPDTTEEITGEYN